MDEKAETRGFIDYIGRHHQVIANLFLVIGVCLTVVSLFFTYRSLNQSAESVKRQLHEQKKATSVLIVSDFFTQVGEHIVQQGSGKKADESLSLGPEFKRLIATRSKLLIETLGFPDLTGQVIRFLGTNGLGILFRSRQDTPYIQLANLNLRNANLADVELSRPNFLCVDMRNVLIMNARLDDATFTHSNLKAGNLTGASLRGANLQWVNLRDAIMNGVTLEGATIAFSDLTGIAAATTAANAGRSAEQSIAEMLASAKSLYGSLLDKGVERELRLLLAARKGLSYEDLTRDPDVLITGKPGDRPEFEPLRVIYRKDAKAMRGGRDPWRAAYRENCGGVETGHETVL